MAKSFISIRGAREHNLKAIDLDIPRDQLTVITGLSGSGKSTLAFDTIYAEGQRKYVESLSAYARQFLDQLQKPDVESIEGLPPTIAIEQRSSSHNPRSTVATTTEIYDFLRLLFARAGRARCWHEVTSGELASSELKNQKSKASATRNSQLANSKLTASQLAHSQLTCGRLITSQSATQIVDRVLSLPESTRVMVLAPVIRGKKGHHKEVFEALSRQGFVRARVDGEVMDLREIAQKKAGTPFTTKTQRYQQHTIEAVVDRVVIRGSDEATKRRSDEGGAGHEVPPAEGASAPGSATERNDDGEAGDDVDVLRQRLAEAVELSLKLAEGLVVIGSQSSESDSSTRNPQLATGNPAWTDAVYSERYACPIHPECSLEALEPRLFSFNSPYGACAACGGLGTIQEFDAELIVSDESLSLTGGAVEAWRKNGPRMNIHYNRLVKRFCRDFGVDSASPYSTLNADVRRILMEGTTAADEKKHDAHFEGVIPNLQRRFESTDSDWVKGRLHQYLSEAACETCHGTRLRPESLHVFLQSTTPGKKPTDSNPWACVGRDDDTFANADDLDGDARLFTIDDVTRLSIEDAAAFFDRLRLSTEEAAIAQPILKEVRARLGFMLSVGLGYLSLNRATSTLSGGESQRIRLATQVGSGLVGCCYVLDEPTIGLHQRDNDRLIATLRHLTDIGNTVLVVEHDEDTIRAADRLIDIGPGPGRHGGRVVAEGPLPEVLDDANSLTAKYLRGEREIPVPDRRTLSPGSTRSNRGSSKAILVKGGRENNLKDIDVAFPLGGLVCVTGVSGSGKSTLVNSILLRAVKRQLLGSRDRPGEHAKLLGADNIDRVIEVDQSPIGRTPRSNPATYTGAFDAIRTLFTKTKEAKVRGYKPGRFSFNVKGGRCEACQGQGTKKIEMHFLPDVYVECEVCRGKRYNRETLEVRYKTKNIADVLDMTIEEALGFFDAFPDVSRLLQALNDVGLTYVQLGQASTTLSGGEAQRVKLATELGKRTTGRSLYILDEPTTGLHFEDVRKLIEVLQRLAGPQETAPTSELGNTLVVIEHNLDVIKCADWIIDLGPEGGDRGGEVVAAGTPEEVMAVEASYTGQYLRQHLAKRADLVAAA